MEPNIPIKIKQSLSECQSLLRIAPKRFFTLTLNLAGVLVVPSVQFGHTAVFDINKNRAHFTFSGSSSGLLSRNTDSATLSLQPASWSKMGLHLLQS